MMLELFREKISFNAISQCKVFLPSPARPFMDSELQNLTQSLRSSMVILSEAWANEREVTFALRVTQ